MSANYQTFFHLFSDSYENFSKAINLSEFRKAINLSEKNYINVLVIKMSENLKNYKPVRKKLNKCPSYMYVRVLKSYINVREIPMNPSEILN